MRQLIDMQTYLPDDILVKVDRASMAHSLETRAPLLDHRLVELAWRIPATLQTSNDSGKRLFKNIAHQYLPEHLMNRPKVGFGVPLDDWLRGPLRPWAEELLSKPRLVQEGFLAPDLIQAKWQEHQQGSRNWQYQLWDILMFQAWLESIQP
jgi:asparagine synthase (glutamine-hydrolysing)